MIVKLFENRGLEEDFETTGEEVRLRRRTSKTRRGSKILGVIGQILDFHSIATSSISQVPKERDVVVT